MRGHAASSQTASRCCSARQSRGRPPGLARSPSRSGHAPAPQRSAHDRARRCSLTHRGSALVPSDLRVDRPVTRRPFHSPSRWPPLWPVLPLQPPSPVSPAPGPNHQARAWRSRPPSQTRWPSPAGPRSPLRSAAATIPAAPAPQPVASFLRSRHCSPTEPSPVSFNVLTSPPHWPVFRWPPMAGFGWPPRARCESDAGNRQ